MARKKPNQIEMQDEILGGDPLQELQRIDARIEWIKEQPYYVNGELFDASQFSKQVRYQYMPEWKDYMQQANKRATEINKLCNWKKKNKKYLEQQIENVSELSAIDLEFARMVVMTKLNVSLHGKAVKPKHVTKQMVENISANDIKTLMQTLKMIVDTQNSIRTLVAGMEADSKEVDKGKKKIEDILGIGKSEKKTDVKKKDAFSLLS